MMVEFVTDPVYAAGSEAQTRELSDEAFLKVNGVRLVAEGKVTGEKVDHVDYDSATNTLTLNNCTLDLSQNQEEGSGISASNMGDDFRICLVGDNTITGKLKRMQAGISLKWSDTVIEGEGKLTMDLEPVEDAQGRGANGYGILAGSFDDLTIDGPSVEIISNIAGTGYFYGITRDVIYNDIDAGITIKDADIDITSTLPAQAGDWGNVGIDAQQGDLKIADSSVDITLTNGDTIGVGAGLQYGDVYGGTLDISGSEVRCTVNTDMGQSYSHGLYFYEMTGRDQLHYYVNDGNSFVEKGFSDAFELDKYMYGRYDTNYNSTVISSAPLPEYCDHKWDEGTVTKEATCTEKGEKTYVCTVCGEKKTEDIAALGHEWGEWEELREATCTEKGARMHTCSRCRQTETEDIPALGHDYVEKIVKEATCTEDGLKNKECTRCHAVVESIVIPATGHDYEWVVTKEATFHEDGVKTGTCKKCQYVKTEPIPKLSDTHEHDFSGREVITKEATCTEEGSKNIYCTEPECGKYITETIPMTAHTPGEWETVKEATCSENGSEQKTCTVCGKVLETRETEKLPHTYGEWTVTEEPACTEAGVETAKCAVCGETTVRGINPLGHDYASWTVKKEATCTEDGEEISVCTRCGETGTRVIEAKGHNFGEWKIVKEATQTEEGERQAVCAECGAVKSEVIPKLSVIQPSVPNGNSGAGSNSAAAADPAGQKSDVPATGDGQGAMLWITALILAAGALITAGKKMLQK